MINIPTARLVSQSLKKHSTQERALGAMRYFKTAPGQYGHGDIFIGVTMPDTRRIAKEFLSLRVPEIKKLLHSKIHEERMVGLLIIVANFEKANVKEKTKWFRLFWSERRAINNWDLVDVTVPRVVGEYFVNRARAPLYRLGTSKILWERRIAILATFAFIRRKDFVDALKIAKLLEKDTHDLIHKAVGWMLREVGKRSLQALEGYLVKNYRQMPRTTLRYAIERLPQKRRREYLAGVVY